MTGQHPITARCWFCASDDDIDRVKAGTPTRRPFLGWPPPDACPFLDEDEQLRPRPTAVPPERPT